MNNYIYRKKTKLAFFLALQGRLADGEPLSTALNNLIEVTVSFRLRYILTTLLQELNQGIDILRKMN